MCFNNDSVREVSNLCFSHNIALPWANWRESRTDDPQHNMTTVEFSPRLRSLCYCCCEFNIFMWRNQIATPHILSRDGIVAFESLQSERVTNARIVNLPVGSCYPLGEFHLAYFASSSNFCSWLRNLCEVFTAVFYCFKRFATCSSVPCALTSLYHHTYAQRVLFSEILYFVC